MNILNPMDIPNYISSSDTGLSLGREHKDIENSRESSECSLLWKRGEAGPT
jgi:hypothetical protein